MYFHHGKIGYRLSDGRECSATFINELGNEHFTLMLKSEGPVNSIMIESKELLHITHFSLTYLTSFRDSQKIFCNGFQSWTESKEYGIHDQIRKYHPWISRFTRPFGDHTYYNYPESPGHLHGWSYGYIRDKNMFTLIASLSDEDAFTLIEFVCPESRVVLSKDCEGMEIKGACEIFKHYISEGEEQDVFPSWMKASGFEHKIQSVKGWTSWYHYYTQISEKIIRSNSEAFEKEQLPCGIFQIDDGWQESLGTWLNTNKKFPAGLKTITDDLHNKGTKAGLWLAPFVCEKKSFIVKEHPDWVLKDKDGKMLKAGYNPLWSGNFYAIDIYHPGFRNYLRDVFTKVFLEWNFDMVKLDFLYAACQLPRKGITRGRVMYDAMNWIRELCGDKLVLACGVPLMPAAGKVDYCRIGADVSPGWNDRLVKFFRIREGISTYNSMLNTVFRRQLNGWWFGNDPDVFILRSEKQSMSKEERKTLFWVNTLLGSLVFTSDKIDEIKDHECKELMRDFFSKATAETESVQMENEVLEIKFSLGGKKYRAVMNLSDRTITKGTQNIKPRHSEVLLLNS